MAETEAKRLAHPEYWDERYTEVGSDKQVHEWFRTFSDLEPFLHRYLFQVQAPETIPRILHLGSGDSTIPQDLFIKGYKNQLCVDFSSVVVETMSNYHAELDGIEWKKMDVRSMDEIPSQSIDVAFDKGTLDAMIYGSMWNPPDEVVENTSQYMRELFRVLKLGGTFIYVTYRQPHFVKPLLNARDTDWDVSVEALGGVDGSFEYYGFIIKKMNPPV